MAVCQFAAGQDVTANAAQCAALIGRAAAAGAQLAVLPEVSMYFDPRRQGGPGPHGQPLDGPFATAIADAAAASGVAVLVGMLESVVGQSRDYNTLLAVSDRGERLGSYRKIHLYDAFGYRESDDYLPGDIGQPLIFTVEDVTVGALTCYDLRFPEAFRWLTDAGADLVALPSAWIVGPAKERHWGTLVAARAIENTIYLAAADQTGPASCGQSIIVDPMGTVIAGAGERPGLAVADIDRQRIAEVRTTNPSLANRRFTVAPR
ncbi:MAG TPA: carbon-nitrogen hydrolase family protein [Nakamurella sp.]|nr:carbon-nitrogen hydrolase family protein [Nakamurella sp.]